MVRMNICLQQTNNTIRFQDVWMAGTTTLCGGLLMELDADPVTQRKLHELSASIASLTKFTYDMDKHISMDFFSQNNCSSGWYLPFDSM